MGLEYTAYALVAFASFTLAQRKAILERDGHKCQAPIEHECNGSPKMPEEDRKLQVHHLIPQRYSEVVGIPNPDFELNGLTLCEKFHQEVIHPDMIEAKKTYYKDKGAFKKVFEARNQKLKNKEVYWNTVYDRQLHVTAVRNSQLARQNGWEFPEKKTK